MALELDPGTRLTSRNYDTSLFADVLVIGGGPAGAWAALTATEAGARVVLVEKGYTGTAGPLSSANTGIYHIKPNDPIHRRGTCELHCPADALYVSPRSEPEPAVDPATIAASGILGSYARALGWHRGAPGGTDDDPGVLLAFNRAPNPNDKVRMQLYNISQLNYIDVESSQVADV